MSLTLPLFSTFDTCTFLGHPQWQNLSKRDIELLGVRPCHRCVRTRPFEPVMHPTIALDEFEDE